MELNAETIVKCDSRAANVNATLLDLSSKGITRIAPGVFDRFNSLQRLNLSFNNFTEIQERVFDTLINLKVIWLHSNNIKSVSVNLFKYNKKLERIRLEENDISKFDEGLFSDLPQLEELCLSDNDLTDLPERIFDTLINLKQIWLVSNKIKSVSVNLFKNNKKLERIRLDENDISKLDEGLFSDLPQLEELCLSDNNLTDLPERVFDTLINLKQIYLYSNKIKSVSVNLFKNNKKLEIIRLEKNNISELDERLFSDLPELQELNINSNKIKTFDFRSLRSSTKLEKLYFGDNNLSEINVVDNLKKLFPQLERCGVRGNNFSKSHLKRVIDSLELQGIGLAGIDRNKGIQNDSVYGLKCIPDDIYIARSVQENQKLREELNNTNIKLDEMQKLILELHNQINDSKTHYEVERPIMLKKFTEMLGHYKSYEKRVDKLRLDTEDRFFREKVELRKKMSFNNKKNVRLEDLIINCQTRIDHLDDKWCQKVDQLEIAYMTERPFILSSLNQLTRDNKSNHKSILKFKTITHYEKMNKIFTKYEEKFKTFQGRMDDAVDNTNLIYINEKSSLLKRLNDFTSQHDRKEREADDWKVNMQNKIVMLNKKFKERSAKCDSKNAKIKNAMAEDGEEIRLLQREMRQKVEETDSFYKGERPAIIEILKRLDKDSIDLAEGQKKADVQLKLIRGDSQKEVNRLKIECKDNFDRLSEDIKGCKTSYNEENVKIKELIVKNDDEMKTLVGEIEQKIIENKNSEEEVRQVIRDKCNKLESDLEEKQRNGQIQANGLRKDFDSKYDKLLKDIEECNATCSKESIQIKESLIKNDEDVKNSLNEMGKEISGRCDLLKSECESLELKQQKNENDIKDNRKEVEEFRVDIKNAVTTIGLIERKLNSQITSTEPILAHYKKLKLEADDG